MIVFWLIVGTILLFGFVVLFGAPYLPALRPQINDALDVIGSQHQKIVELGCGDGRVLIAAANRGHSVVGYELNPLLAIVAWARTRRYKDQIKVVWGNFWNHSWPEADVIFVFLLDKYMEKLDKKIIQEYSGKNVKVVSIAFKIPGKKPTFSKKGLFLYQY